jgi:hypothetical protein
MAAVEVAPGGALPEKVVEFMYLCFIVPEKPEKKWIHRRLFLQI